MNKKAILKKDLKSIKTLLAKTGIKSSKFTKVSRMGGLTNRSYHLVMKNGDELAVRLPGEGTEEMICRDSEKISTELAYNIGIDSELIYFGEDGSKVTRYINDAKTMNAKRLRKRKHIKNVAKVFRKLHRSGVNTEVPFDVFDMAASYENIIRKNNVELYADYSDIKKAVMEIKETIDSEDCSNNVPCHNDPLCENWVYGEGRMYLVDWEYAGMNDAMWDLADVSIEADFKPEQDELLLERYFKRKAKVFEIKRFIANKIYLDYLWTLWGLTRVPFDGQEMQNYADARYVRLKKNIGIYQESQK